MKKTRNFMTAVAGLILSAATALAHAAPPVKVGLILPMTGPYAIYGKSIENGVRLYLQENGKTFGGRDVEIVVADDTGVAPEIAKRAAQSLIVKDKVDILAGFGLTPSALTVAPLATQAKVPMVIMNAATTGITTKSPYVMRTSQSQPQMTAPMAIWAAQNNIKKVYTLVADYSPGIDAETQFKTTFTANGGTVIGEVRYPLNTTDPSPYLQRIKDANPDGVFVFLPPGELSISFIRGFADRGLAAAGIKLLGTSITEEAVLDATGDKAIGVITALNWAESHSSPENAAFVAAYRRANPSIRPNYMAVSGYDGMALIAKVLEKTKGNAAGDAFVAAARGMSWTSPRGPIQIDEKHKDIVQTVYIRKTEKKDGVLQNVEFFEYPAFKDPLLQ